jgi:hypothetical protein
MLGIPDPVIVAMQGLMLGNPIGRLFWYLDAVMSILNMPDIAGILDVPLNFDHQYHGHSHLRCKRMCCRHSGECHSLSLKVGSHMESLLLRWGLGVGVGFYKTMYDYLYIYVVIFHLGQHP